MMRFTIATLLLLGACSGSAGQAEPPLRWWKGNTHTHTLWSDGDAAPDWAVDGYREKGYHFLVLSDHNIVATGEKWVRIGSEPRAKLTPRRVEAIIARFGASQVEQRQKGEVREMRLRTLDELRASFEIPGKFILVTGEEITDRFKRLPIHHNMMNHPHLVKPTGGTSVRDVMRRTGQALSALGIRDFPLLNDSDGVPIWPDGVVGSLSHCECYCGVAVARKGRIRSVGFDAEPASPLPMELRSLICSEKEIAWIKRQPPPTYGDWYKLFFCAKESTFKAFFPIVRLPFDFWELEIELQPGSNGFAVSCSSHCDVTTGQLLGRFYISDRHILTGVTIF